MNILFVVYANTESILEKLHTCDNDPEKFLHIKKKEIQSMCLFNTYARIYEEDVTDLNADLTKHEKEIFSCEKAEMLQLADEQNEPYINQEICHICIKQFDDDGQNHEKL